MSGSAVEVEKERSITEIKRDLRRLCYLVIRELMNDFSVYNRFPELKEHYKGIMLNGNKYNKEYYESLLEEVKGDFVVGICCIYSISYVDFVNHCLTNRMIYIDDAESGNPRSTRLKIGERKIRDKSVRFKVRKALKGNKK